MQRRKHRPLAEGADSRDRHTVVHGPSLLVTARVAPQVREAYDSSLESRPPSVDADADHAARGRRTPAPRAPAQASAGDGGIVAVGPEAKGPWPCPRDSVHIGTVMGYHRRAGARGAGSRVASTYEPRKSADRSKSRYKNRAAMTI